MTAASAPADTPEAKNARLRKNITDEIVETEKTYVDSLELLITNFVKPLTETGRQRFPELYSNPKGDVTMLFSTISLVQEGNKLFYENLVAGGDASIGLTFSNMLKAEKFEYYTVFCNHQEEAAEQLRLVSKSDKAFAEWLGEQAQVGGRQLLELLALPFQRYSDYLA